VTDLDYLIESRRETWLMWERVAARRRRGSRGWLRANVHAGAANMMLGFAYRMSFERGAPTQS
jgi:hypothetical protein